MGQNDFKFFRSEISFDNEKFLNFLIEKRIVRAKFKTDVFRMFLRKTMDDSERFLAEFENLLPRSTHEYRRRIALTCRLLPEQIAWVESHKNDLITRKDVICAVFNFVRKFHNPLFSQD